MVVKLVRWPSRPPFSSKKCEAIIIIQRLEGLRNLSVKDAGGLIVEVKWKGQKIMGLSSWRRSVKRNYTEKGKVCENGASVNWNEEFRNFCSFLGLKEDSITPWEVSLTVLQKGENQVPRNGCTVIATGSLNLAEYASSADGKEIQMSLPLKVRGSMVEPSPSLLLSLRLLELRTDTKHVRMVQRSIMPVTLSPPSSLALSTEKDGLAAIKAGLDRVNIFGYCVSAGRTKEAFHKPAIAVNRLYIKDEDFGHSSSLDSDSLDDSCARQPFGYDKLAHVNRAAGLFADAGIGNGDECWIDCVSDAGCVDVDRSQTMQQNSMRKILSWKKRKLSFKSSKNKSEPLLKRHYGEEGGDDIDFDRRQLSANEIFSAWYNVELSVAAFGDDNFAVGAWEQKHITSRDGQFKLQTEVFFASIDQRSERAAGESACTALVAVIADWLLTNRNEMPIKSELDSLIKDGSAEWRNLCENKDYIEQFTDKHFDLDTVINAKIRPLSVAAEKSYVGFFHPEGLEEGVFEFLQEAMSFDTIWDEISQLAASYQTNGEDSLVYIISWNDHFFILKVESDAYYIIDTLGERLYEGCNQAYILKFDKDSKILRVSNKTKASQEKPSNDDKMQSNNIHPSDSEAASTEKPTEVSPAKPMEDSSVEVEDVSMADPKEATSKDVLSVETKTVSKVETKEASLAEAEEVSSMKMKEVLPVEPRETFMTEVPLVEMKEASSAKNSVESQDEVRNGDTEEVEVVCTGKECCQEYIKSFLAAIPIRELQEDVKKGLNSSLHQRLQIEFHRTKVIFDQILAKPTTDDYVR